MDSEKECPSNCPVDSEKNKTEERVKGQGQRCKIKLIYGLIVNKYNVQFCKNAQSTEMKKILHLFKLMLFFECDTLYSLL